MVLRVGNSVFPNKMVGPTKGWGKGQKDGVAHFPKLQNHVQNILLDVNSQDIKKVSPNH